MPDKVYSHASILNSFSKEKLIIMQTKLEKAKNHALNFEWGKLFGNGKV